MGKERGIPDLREINRIRKWGWERIGLNEGTKFRPESVAGETRQREATRKTLRTWEERGVPDLREATRIREWKWERVGSKGERRLGKSRIYQ